MKRLRLSISLAIILLAWTFLVSAQARGPTLLIALQGGTSWSELSTDEQKLLRTHADNWKNYPPKYQQQLQGGARRYFELSPHEQQRIRRIRREYQHKSPEERQRLRESYRHRHREN
ncbi:MAG: DUF3106 domain-containing protein [Gammaproteobacteria bacterium]